jgi:D-3-phosphoglycerate dehydrogenase / 2-oxoglutarate reductase
MRLKFVRNGQPELSIGMADRRGSTPTVVITDCDHPDVEPERAVFGEAGVEVRLEQCTSGEDVIAVAADADALIVQYAPIGDEVLDALERCRGVVRYGVGVDTIDVEAATRRGVWVVNVPDYGTEEVSDHAVALLLSLLRGVVALDRSVRDGRWDESAARPLHRLSTRTVGVVGCGRIGAAFARKARGLGLPVQAHDPAGVPGELRAAGVQETSLEELIETSDAVSLHLPLGPDSEHLIDAGALERMRRGAYLINTSRGGLVDSGALLSALQAGRIAGAALDVLESEPPAAGDALVNHERVIVTPHAAWYSEESSKTLKSEVAREAIRIINRERPRSPVNDPSEVRTGG